MKIYSNFKKLSLLLKISIFIIFSLLLYKLYNNLTYSQVEGFTQDKKFVIYEKIHEIFDLFYADIYDQILLSGKKT